MAKFNSETLLRLVRGDYLLLQKCSTELGNLALPNHLQLTLFVPLPFPAPGSAPVQIVWMCSIKLQKADFTPYGLYSDARTIV